MARLMAAFALAASFAGSGVSAKAAVDGTPAADSAPQDEGSGPPDKEAAPKTETPPDNAALAASRFVAPAGARVEPPAAPSPAPGGGFNPAEAQTFLAYSRLPMEFEEMLLSGKSQEEARAEIARKLPEGVEGTVLRRQNSTAVVAYDAARGVIRVMYDGTTEPADRKDNAKFWREGHPLGGKIHHGYHGAILKEGPDGQRLVDAVRDQVEVYAAKAGKPVEVDLTGFSRGGSMAIATAAQWMAEDFANGTEGIKLKNVYTFASPAVGNAEFCRDFTAAAQAGNVNVTRVVAGGDTVPYILTAEAPWYMPGLYDQAGEAYYIGADKQGKMRALQDPGKKEIEAFRDQSAAKHWHDPDVYQQTIQDYVAAGTPMCDRSTAEKPTRTAAAPLPKTPHM